MFKGKTAEAEFQGQALTIQGVSVYRAIALRNKVTGEGEETEENLKVMAELIAECIVEPKISVDEALGLDIDTFRDLFQVVIDNNGMNMGNSPEPETK